MEVKKYEITIKSEVTDFMCITIHNSQDAERFARNFYHEDIKIYESVFIIFLNRKNTTIGYAKISQGGISSSVIDGKIICKYAIDVLASNIILVHNHPSGSTKPSKIDYETTDNIRKQLSVFDIQLLDHIILTDDDYYSFADNN